MTFIDYIKNGDATKATALLEAVMKQKTLASIKEQRATVAESTYGDQEDLDESVDLDESNHPWEGELTSRGYKKTGFERVPGQVFKGAITHHKFTHPNGHNVTLTNNRGNDLHGFIAPDESGSSKSHLVSHLNKVHGTEK